MWANDFELLNNGDQERFKKISNYLLNKTFMLSVTYEPRDRIGKYNGDYIFLERNFATFKGFFDFAGYSLMKDDAKGIIYIESDYGFNNTHLDKFTTLFLLCLREVYDEEIEKNSSKNVVFVKVADILYRMLEDKLILKKPTIKETSDCVRSLIRYNVLSRIEGNVEDVNCVVTIYPTITKVVSNEKINAIYKIMFKEDEVVEEYDFGKE